VLSAKAETGAGAGEARYGGVVDMADSHQFGAYTESIGIGPALFSQEKTDKGGRHLREDFPRSFWRVEVKGAMLEPIDSQAEYRLECLAVRI